MGVNSQLLVCTITSILLADMFVLCAAMKSIRNHRSGINCLLGPGTWNLSETAGSRWKPLAGTMHGRCRVQNLLSVLESISCAILFLSDSIDRNLIKDYCEMVGGNVTWNVTNHRGTYDMLNRCTAVVNSIHLFQMFLPGVHLEGPWLHNLTGNALSRSAYALDAVRNLTGRLPDLVVIGSNIWDVSRVHHLDRSSWNFTQPAPLQWSQTYVQNLSRIFHFVRSYYATPPQILFRTTPIPDHDCQTGQQYVISGTVAATAAVNALGRYAAYRNGIPVVDTELMTRPLQPAQYIRDYPGGGHPSSVLMLELLNLYLNMCKIQHSYDRRLAHHS
jgi:hypothetical protein